MRWRAHYLIGQPGPTYDLLPNIRFTEIEAIFLAKVTQSRHRALWKWEALSAYEALGDQVHSMTGLRKGEQKHSSVPKHNQERGKQLSRSIPLDWLNLPYSQSLSDSISFNGQRIFSAKQVR